MSGPSRHFVHLLLSCTFAALPGCASLPSETPKTTLDVIASQQVPFGVRTQAADGQFEVLPSSLIARRLQVQLGDRPLSILALSAGGAGGAFGAGAVVGLDHGGTRSAFSVVTGVSAGALVAPYAFLGPAWDQEITAIYT